MRRFKGRVLNRDLPVFLIPLLAVRALIGSKLPQLT